MFIYNYIFVCMYIYIYTCYLFVLPYRLKITYISLLNKDLLIYNHNTMITPEKTMPQIHGNYPAHIKFSQLSLFETVSN